MKKFLVFIMSCSLFGSGVLGAVEPGEASVFGKNRALYGEYQAVCELLRGRTDSAQLAERFESVCACLCTQESCPSDFTEQMKVIVRALARGGERDSADRAAVEAFIQHARAGRFAWKKAVLVVAGLVATALLAKKLRDRKEVAVVPAKSDPIGTALGAHVAASGVESQVAISGLEPYVVTPEIIAKETQRVQELEQMLEAARERKSAVARKNGIVPLFTEQQREYATEKIVGFIQKHKPSYDGARERQQNQLRAFVSAPHAQGTKFEKMADIIGQIPEISCESFKRDQAEAALFLRERSAYDSLWVETSIFEVTLPKFSTEAKHYFIDNTLALEQRLIAEFNKFGVASSLKPTDLKRKYNYSNDGIPVDHVFVIKFTPHRAVDGKSSVVLKIPNPYAYYSNQQRYLSGPYEGENHSGFRNVERVLIAEKIRQAGEGVLSVAEKHIALRSGSSLGGPINDATAIVMSDCLSFQ
ncbi:MAG: hypothetical protein QG632_371, partial [Candidatus Dependentiae bacterium]|nr:hypothetical protein [Candidatus Dependentiae bacterium]